MISTNGYSKDNMTMFFFNRSIPASERTEGNARKGPARAFSLGLALLALMGILGCGNDPESTFESAVASYKDKNPLAAQDSLRKALALKPDYVPAYLLLARLAEMRGDKDSAVLNYRSAYDIAKNRDFKLMPEDIGVREDPELRLQWEEAAINLGRAEFRSKNYNRAISYYDTVIASELSPEWIRRAFEEKEVTREFFDLDKKLASLRQQNYANPDDPRIQAEFSALFMEMASGITRLGNLKEVADFIAQSSKFREQAKEDLNRIYDASPEIRLKDTEALLAYTESQELLMRGKQDQALEKAREACELAPNESRYQFAVASILNIMSGSGDNAVDYSDEILVHAKKATELSPEVWRYLIFYAGRLQDRGQLEESHRTLEKVRRVTSDPQVLKEVEDTLRALESAIAANKAGGQTAATGSTDG
jgi:tetratricopeptide (TPR) repeat protein